MRVGILQVRRCLSVFPRRGLYGALAVDGTVEAEVRGGLQNVAALRALRCFTIRRDSKLDPKFYEMPAAQRATKRGPPPF